MDAGPILHQAATPIGPDETAGALTDRLAILGAEALIEALALMRLGRLPPRPQDHTRATFAPKIDRAVCRIDWSEPTAQVIRRIRAFDPAPGAWTRLNDLELKLFTARPVGGSGIPGEVLAADTMLRIATEDSAVEVSDVQPAGKARMAAVEWIRGRGVVAGQRLG
jgi:methionyl-tRNA formyltransferase